MNLNDVRRGVERVREAVDAGDNLRALNRERNLFMAVLCAIQDGHTDPVELANAALKTTEFQLSRLYT